MKAIHVVTGLIFFLVLGVVLSLFVFSTTKQSTQLITPVSKTLISPSIAPKTQKTWSLLITGDIIPARVVNQRMTEKQDFAWPLKNIESILKDADITLIDLEAPLLSSCPVTNEGFKFCGDARFTTTLKNAGVDIANLANNHSLNYGWEGIRETQELLKANSMVSTGFTVNDVYPKDGMDCSNNSSCSDGQILTINGLKIGFLGYNAVGQRLDESVIKPQMEIMDKDVDLLITSVHWGKEYERVAMADSSLAPDDPKIWGKKFIDWGTDVVVGNHPHWYQGVEWYNDKPIFYAMGNTVFDQEWSTETKRGYLAKLTFSDTTVTKETISYIPIGIRDYGETYLLEGKEKEEILNFLNK